MCSIPGCSGFNNILKQTKLHRVPAISVESSGLMLDLTKKRREKWFEVLKDCGLTEHNSSSYKVCSKHFKEDKPSSTVDVNSEDWVPTMNLPEPETQNMSADSVDLKSSDENCEEEPSTVEPTLADENGDEVPSTALPVSTDRDTEEVANTVLLVSTKENSEKVVSANLPVSTDELLNSTDENNEVTSAFVHISTDVPDAIQLVESDVILQDIPESLPQEPPFIFVDIKKIAEDKSSLLKESDVSLVNSISKDISNISEGTRSFGVQTNQNVLPPLNWGRRKNKKLQDPRFQNVQIQTDPISKFKLAICETDPVQACMGEIIDFIRKQLLGFNLKASGKSFTIKECALHFEGNEEVSTYNNKDNKVVVQPSRLLSSNWTLLESVATSIDLYRLQKKDKELAGFVRTLNGKSEIIEQSSNGSVENYTSPVYKKVIKKERGSLISINDENQNTCDDRENSFSQSKGLVSPVMPKITKVMSLGDSSDDTLKEPSRSTKPKQHSDPKSIKLSSLNLVSTQSSSSRKRNNTKTSRSKKTKREQMKKLTSTQTAKMAEELKIQSILNNKIPRVILPKLPANLLDKALNGEKISVENLKPAFCHLSDDQQKNVTPPLLWVSNVKNEGQKTSVPFHTVKNIPLKLGQTKDVAGYLLLGNDGTTGSSQIMYVPKIPTDRSDIQSDLNVNFAGLLKKGVKTLLVPSTFLPQSSGTPQVASASSSTNFTAVSNVNGSDLGTVTDNDTSKKDSSIIKVKLKSPKDQKKKKKNDNQPKKARHRKIFDDTAEDFDDDFSAIEVTEPEPVDEELKCPYCNLVCEDGVDFINHRKTSRCKGLRGMATQNLRCEQCKRVYKKDSEHDCPKSKQDKPKNPDCNVCGLVFTKYSYLSNHVKTHLEYDVWTNRCGACPKKFPNKKELTQHSKNWHSELLDTAKYTCHSCKKVFSTPKRLDHHVEKAHAVPPPNKKCNIKIRCKICREVFDLDHYRQTHWKECQEKENKEKNAKQDQKKPTAIRSKVPAHKKETPDELIEKELSKMFGDNAAHDESSGSEYEQEELLSTGFEEISEETRAGKTRDKKENKKRKRFRNLYGSDSEDSEEPLLKVTKIDKQEPEEIRTRTKFDFKDLLGVNDGANDITIEEMEEEEAD